MKWNRQTTYENTAEDFLNMENTIDTHTHLSGTQAPNSKEPLAEWKKQQESAYFDIVKAFEPMGQFGKVITYVSQGQKKVVSSPT